MNKKLLEALKRKNELRLQELRSKVEKQEVRGDELKQIEKEIDTLVEELQEVADELSKISENSEEENNNESDKKEEKSGDEGETQEEEETRSEALTVEQRNGLLGAISKGLEVRGKMNKEKKENEIRSAFANFVVGTISEGEARSLGIETGNGSVTVPEVIASEIITYAQEENLLRKFGTVVRTKGDIKYPVLVKKATANVVKKERGISGEIPETDIEFDEILLNPTEFDALATVTKKLLKMSGAPVEQIVIEELKKAYVRKEANYMFNGDDENNENPGALSKKAVVFTPSDKAETLYDKLVEMKNTPSTEVMKKSRWMVNRAALTKFEQMKTKDGFPLIRPFTQVEGGIGKQMLGFPLEVTDNVDKKDNVDLPIVYFGDYKSFKIQDVIGGMQIQKLIEKFSGTNRVGFQIYNLLDGQLIYSPLEPTVYKFEIVEEETPPTE